MNQQMNPSQDLTVGCVDVWRWSLTEAFLSPLLFFQEFAGEDTSDLFLEEREASLRQAQEEKHKIQMSVPGILNPHEIPEEMCDWAAAQPNCTVLQTTNKQKQTNKPWPQQTQQNPREALECGGRPLPLCRAGPSHWMFVDQNDANNM